jgi:hypothetical protein
MDYVNTSLDKPKKDLRENESTSFNKNLNDREDFNTGEQRVMHEFLKNTSLILDSNASSCPLKNIIDNHHQSELPMQIQDRAKSQIQKQSDQHRPSDEKPLPSEDDGSEYMDDGFESTVEDLN